MLEKLQICLTFLHKINQSRRQYSYSVSKAINFTPYE